MMNHPNVTPGILSTLQDQQVLLSLLPQGVLLVDSHHNIQFLNSKFANWFNIIDTVTVNQHLSAVFPTIVYECAKISIEKAFAGIPTIRQYSLKVEGQAARMLRLHYETVPASVEHPQGRVMIIAEDITETTEMRLNLLKAQQELERFAHIASHDLKTPLRNISIYTGLLGRKLPTNLHGETASFFKEINQNCHKAYELIESILEVSTLRNHQISLSVINCAKLLDELVQEMRHKYTEAQVEVTFGYLPQLVADKALLRIIFYHLLDNGIKFNQSKRKRIHIEAKSIGKSYQFTIADNGIGIEADYQDQLFVLFQKLHPDSAYPGSGTGLAICKQLIELHQGNIWIESAENNTLFHFTIPTHLQIV